LAFVDITTGNPVGLNNNDGTWLLHPSDLANLGVKTRGGSNGTAHLTLTTVATENDGDRATSATTFDVTVTPGNGGGDSVDPLPPQVTINAMNTNEDGAVTFDVTAEADPNDPSPTPPSVNVIIRGIPAGAQVTGATYNPVNDTWVADADTVNSGAMSVTPPKDFSGTMNITLEAVATNDDLNSASTGILDAPIDVTPVADGPDVAVTSPAGIEDAAIPLDISLALRDTNGEQNEVIDEPIVITLDNGASLNHGTDQGGGVWHLTQADLDGLAIIPAANWHGDIHVSVAASTTEPANGDQQTTTVNATVTVDALADAPAVTTQDVSGDEGTVIDLTGLSASLVDTDGSEVLSVKISGVPHNAILSAGTNNGDGSWTIDPADLANLSIRLPRNYSGDRVLTLHAFSLDANGTTAETAQDFTVHVNPVPDKLLMTLLPQSGDEGTDIALDMNIVLGDKRGYTQGENPPETAEITFSNVPSDVIFHNPAGGVLTDNHDGTWHFSGTRNEANALTILSTGTDGDVTIDVSAQANDNGVLGNPRTGSITITFNKVDDQTLTGTNGDDSLTGAAGNDVIHGLAGNDVMDGGSGHDSLYGDAGIDIISGGYGSDWISGGDGNDTLTGGQGADSFAYANDDIANGAVDSITDFSTTDGDALEIAGILNGYDPQTDALTDYVNLVESNGNTLVQVDVNGNGNFTTDLAVLTGVTGLDVDTMEQNGNLVAVWPL